MDKHRCFVRIDLHPQMTPHYLMSMARQAAAQEAEKHYPNAVCCGVQMVSAEAEGSMFGLVQPAMRFTFDCLLLAARELPMGERESTVVSPL